MKPHPAVVSYPHLAEKLCCELEGIFLWAFEGLQRLVQNNFRFTESARAKSSRELIRQDANNILLFMESEGYIRLTADGRISAKELYQIYSIWCEENSFSPLKPRSFSDFLIGNQKKYGIEHNNNPANAAGRRVWGFSGIEPLLKLPMQTCDGWRKDYSKDNPFA